jgi:enediyne biosynthesis protein E4
MIARKAGLAVAVTCVALVTSLAIDRADCRIKLSPAPSGIEFVLRNGATPEKHQIEIMVGGVAVIDYDRDGLPDLYFVNGARQPQLDKSDPSYWNRLYKNGGGFRFQDVTERAGVRGEGYQIGAAAGDYDNDGYPDLFVTGVNRDILYRNRGDGTFEDVTVKAGLSPRTIDRRHPWGVSAGWFDYDRDGLLDLFISNYVVWNPASEPFCGDTVARKYRAYCHPKYYQGLPSQLFHNNGDGTFSDVSAASGIGRLISKGMGVAFADYDGDGDLDVLLANDSLPNFLFRNEGSGRFVEAGLDAGVAVNDDGRALSSMGVDFRDIDNDGLPDLWITALANETFPFYRNLGKGLFSDATYPTRIGAATMQSAGWSNGVVDLDNDGRKDLLAACGDAQDNTEVFSSLKSRQQNLVLQNEGAHAFTACAFGTPALHRGAVFGDFDRDGRMDVVVTRIADTPVVYRNESARDQHWLMLRLIGSTSNRDGLGTQVRVITGAGQQVNQATTTVGYASSSQPLVHFGLGTESQVRRIEIRWPNGSVQRLENVPADRYLDVREGS